MKAPRFSGVQDRPVPWRFRLVLFSLLPATVLIQILAKLTPGAVERLYSRGLYPVVQKIVSGLTDWTVWSIAEWLLILLAAVVALKTIFELAPAERRLLLRSACVLPLLHCSVRLVGLKRTRDRLQRRVSFRRPRRFGVSRPDTVARLVRIAMKRSSAG